MIRNVLFALPALLALSLPAQAQHRTVDQPVIYGQDDRTEVPGFPDAGIRTLAESSIITIIPKVMIEVDSGGNVALLGSSLGQAKDLCPGERFADQPASGICSGTLIGPDLVLTAGHCFSNPEAGCGAFTAVFNYQWDGSGLEPITTDDVFSCTRVIAHAQSESGGVKRDYAVFQLDRPATNYTPANVASSRPNLTSGDPFVLIGSPSGIPVKIDTGGRVRDPRSQSGDYWTGTPDTFGGNSGSGVFDANTLDLIGVLVEGDTDYIADGNCQRVNVCAESGCGGENILYARAAIDALCDAATDEVLCGTSAQCGDGFCAYDEDASNCANDCAPPRCGDDICQRNEWNSCDEDCDVVVPDAWTCDPSYYGTLDGCDCQCGTLDPDCELGQQVLNCNFGEVCGEFGQCEEDLASLCDEGCVATQGGNEMGALASFAIVGLLLFGRRRWAVA